MENNHPGETEHFDAAPENYFPSQILDMKRAPTIEGRPSGFEFLIYYKKKGQSKTDPKVKLWSTSLDCLKENQYEALSKYYKIITDLRSKKDIADFTNSRQELMEEYLRQQGISNINDFTILKANYLLQREQLKGYSPPEPSESELQLLRIQETIENFAKNTFEDRMANFKKKMANPNTEEGTPQNIMVREMSNFLNDIKVLIEALHSN